MDDNIPKNQLVKRKERKFSELKLNEPSTLFTNDDATNPVLIIQSPKTPTLSRKQKAASLDSETGQPKKCLDVSRDVNSVPNTPKKQPKPPDAVEQIENDCISQDFAQKLMLTPMLGSNLKRFASNTSISGSQTLKTLPEVMTLQEFSGIRTEPVRIKAKGLLERRGSNASLTIDLGSNTNLTEQKIVRPPAKLNTAKSVSNLNLTSFGFEKCMCHKCPGGGADAVPQNKKQQNEKCGNCTIYESVPSNNSSKVAAPPRQQQQPHELCKCNLKFLPRYYIERHCVCNMKFRRKSLSNENLYVPPCNFCHFGSKDCHLNRSCCSSSSSNKGSRKALYPRQTYIETSQLLSEDFKLHLQNVQYLQTAGSVLSIAELKSCCQMEKIPKLHQEFWEVPLNLQEKCLVSGSQSRNRYKGVLPNEHSRVHLPGTQPYIHANYIKGPDYTETAYIATQGPMSHTCEDFWNMVWTNRIHRIVMLTALVERGRNKCELYFPLGDQGESNSALYSDGTSTLGLIDVDVSSSSSSKEGPAYLKCFGAQYSYEEDAPMDLVVKNEETWGPYSIKYLSKEYLGKCIIRKLELSKTDAVESSRQILHYWYPNWADHKLANPEQVLKIALHVLNLNSSDDETTTTTTTTHNNHHAECCTKTISFDNNNVLHVANTQKRFNFASSKASKFNFDHSDVMKLNSTQTETEKFVRCPLLVHCSAGIGRTGCFLAILNGIHQLRTNYNVDILAIVCSLRLNRGGMVQTAEQYELIHRVLSLYTDMI